MSNIFESENSSILETEKGLLENKHFLPLGYGDEWVVYIPIVEPVDADVESLRQSLNRISDVYDAAFKPAVMELYEHITIKIDEINPSVVLKVARVNVTEKGVYVYSEKDLQEMSRPPFFRQFCEAWQTY